MNCQFLIDYLQARYKITYSHLSYYQGIYYADLGISAPQNPFALDCIYSCGADSNKEMAILKAIIEIIERVIFISPLVGPIDFIEHIPYVRDESNELIPIEKVSPYFSTELNFSSKGLACHTEAIDAKNLSIMEYYETKILELLNAGLMEYVDEINSNFSVLSLGPTDKTRDDVLQILFNESEKFDGCLIANDHCYFVALWHSAYPEYLLGSACAVNEAHALYKALIEANGKWEKIDKNECSLSEIADLKFDSNLTAGRYDAKFAFKAPNIIRRHHQILSDLNLFMYQCA